MPQKLFVWCLVVVCITLLAFTLMVRNSLCELHVKQGNTEVTVAMAYESER
ncbi:Hok/Gef family protein [Serratia fonticola]|uniref:Hok/Gef family protein n=1 Tax=Serratia fonticola TaxID=47917 RepID=UPI001377497C|nr:Hok/Gef family protein [Serratia fonticola]NCG54490.1 Hok/Gef family protein [Serratia fonticola]